MKKTFKLLGFLFLLSTAQSVFSHGTVIYPASRIYNCYTNPSDAGCGSCGEAIYNWMGVLQPDTQFGNHQAFVPDGQIASGGNGSAIDFTCLDALTTDWSTTTVNHGYIDVLWQNTAPHKTEYYKVYITPLNWDPTKPLLWNELIEIGSVGKGPAAPFTTIQSFIPDSYDGKRAAIVSVWQRDYNDSHEAFYSVSDVLVSGGVGCTTGDPANVTFANNTNCTLEYFQNNSLQGSANSGSSYVANTTVGSLWEARETSGEQVDSFTIACGQSIYASEGACNGSTCAAGDPVSVTFQNNTDCTLEYYQGGSLQGSAVAGSTYIANTTVDSHWNALETSGEQKSHFHIVCDLTTYTSTGNCIGDTGGCAPAYGPYPNVYMTGDVVSYNGNNYECLADNLFNVTPGTVAHWWKDLGPCSNGGCNTGDAVNVTFTNNTDCTLEYYQNNSLQGSASVGGTYLASTTVGSQWDAREPSGEQVSNFTIVCNQATYNSTGSCNGNTGGCATAYGPYPNVYMTGDVVSFNGNNYECLADNLFNVTPGTAAHWWKDLGPCSANSNARFMNKEDAGAMNKEELFGELDFVVFPNPAKDFINLEIVNLQSSSYTIAINGMDGRTIETIIQKVPESSIRVNKSIKINKLSPGIYFVNIIAGDKTRVQKFIIE